MTDTISEHADDTLHAGEPLVEMIDVGKAYGAIRALRGVNLTVRAGEVTCVLGDNGAGKSTLIKSLSGAVTPDHGEIRLAGEVVHFRSPMDARAAGIETVYQHLALSPALSIADNMFLGREIRREGPLGSIFRMLDRPKMAK
ncbi:MAG: ATP-binding cassette domain-containing protein, partial [Ornithinibacter sp.]